MENMALLGVAPERADYASMSDELLMHALAKGAREALEILYDRYLSGCFGLALKIVQDPSVAEEVVQDVFLKLWTRPESFVAGRGKFTSWLLTLVHNRSVDRLRRAKSGAQANSVPLDAGSEGSIPLAEVVPDTSPTPYDEAWRSEQKQIVRQAVYRLPRAQREAIALAYFGGLTQKEIAERLGEPLGTIKTRTRSGLMALRRLLGGEGVVEEAGDPA